MSAARALSAACLALLGASACMSGRARTPPAKDTGRFGVARPSRTPPLLAEVSPSTTLLAMDAGVAGDRVSGLLDVPDDQCAAVIARAGGSVEDVDLFAYGEDGSVVGSDEAPDKTPALLICPPHPRRVWITARIASGHGLVAIGAQLVAPANAERVAAMYGLAHGADPTNARVGAWPGLDERIAAHRRDLGGAWQDVRRVGVPLDARLPTRVSAQVDAGRCLDAFVVPSDEVGHLELIALDANGGILGRAESSGRERFVVVCAPIDAPIGLEIRPQSGRGIGVLTLSRTRPGSEGDIDGEVTRLESFPVSDLSIEVRERQSGLARNGYAAGKSVTPAPLEVSRRISVPLALAAGCSRLDVIGGLPLRGLEAWIWSAQGALVSHMQSGGHAVLFACGPGGPARLDLEATLRAGPSAVLVHSEPDMPAALVAHPLAAGRLLAHAVERGTLRRGRDVGQVLELPLSSTEQKSIDLTVPFGRCMDVTLALGADTLGAEVRLVAASTGEEVALSRGPHVTSARVCALDAQSAQNYLKTRAELRVSSGAGKALATTRMSSPAR